MRLKSFFLIVLFGIFAQGAFATSFQLIDSFDALNHVCNIMRNKKYIAVDLEFKDHKLCLIQVCWGTGKDDGALIDYCALKDIKPKKSSHALGPFASILENAKITKVFHAPSQDLRILYDLMGKLPKSVKDTQAMYATLKPKFQAGYAYVLRDMLQIEVNKAQQCSLWEKRPLTEAQLSYATADVSHLYNLYPILHEQLMRLGRLSFLEEHCERTLSKDYLIKENSTKISELIETAHEQNTLKDKFVTLVMAALKKRAEELSMAQQILATKSDVERVVKKGENFLLTGETGKFLGWEITFLLEKYHEIGPDIVNKSLVVQSIRENFKESSMN